MKTNRRLISAFLVVTVVGGSSLAELIVYEGFGYSPSFANVAEWDVPDNLLGPGKTYADYILAGEPVHQDGTDPDVDATGLAGTWDEVGISDNDNMFLKTGSMSFGDLATSGNRIGFKDNLDWDINNRALSSEAQSALGNAGGIWFSILTEKFDNRWSSAEGGLVLANQVVPDRRICEIGVTTAVGGTVGFGIAPTTAGNDWTAYAWDGTTAYVGDDSLVVAVNSTTGNDVHLLVGHVSFDTGSGGADQYVLYEYQLNGGSVVDGTLSQICSTVEVDLDQSTLDVLNVTRQMYTDYDEFRLGTSLADVLGLEEGPSTDGTVIMLK